MGFLGLKYACLDIVCPDSIWLLFYIGQIYLQDGVPRDIGGAEEAWFFAKLS